MEIAILIGVGWVIYTIFKSFQSGNQEAAVQEQAIEAYSKHIQENKFKGKVKFQNSELTAFIRGTINATGKIALAIHINEKKPDGSPGLPIQSFIPYLQAENSSMFEIKMPLSEDWEEDRYYTDWVDLLNPIPFNGSTIRCPTQGKNKLLVTFNIFNPDTDGIYETATSTFTYDQVERGMLDRIDDVPKIRKQMICFAMRMCYEDGKADDSEIEVIKTWMKNKFEYIEDESEKEKVKKDCNAEVAQALNLAKQGKLNLDVLLKSFNEIADKGDKWELIELLRDVMAADEEAEARELKMMRDVQVGIGIDPEEFQKMLDEALPKIKKVSGLDEAESGDKCLVYGNLLGIDSSWSTEEKKKKLASEFNKHNGLANAASTENERQNANKMLENISYYRKNCL